LLFELQFEVDARSEMEGTQMPTNCPSSFLPVNHKDTESRKLMNARIMGYHRLKNSIFVVLVKHICPTALFVPSFREGLSRVHMTDLPNSTHTTRQDP
jgi:hypothetical protein